MSIFSGGLPQNRCFHPLCHSLATKQQSHIPWLLPVKKWSMRNQQRQVHHLLVTMEASNLSEPYLQELDHAQLGVRFLLLCGSFAEELSGVHLVPVIILPCICQTRTYILSHTVRLLRDRGTLLPVHASEKAPICFSSLIFQNTALTPCQL